MRTDSDLTTGWGDASKCPGFRMLRNFIEQDSLYLSGLMSDVYWAQAEDFDVLLEDMKPYIELISPGYTTRNKLRLYVDGTMYSLVRELR